MRSLYTCLGYTVCGRNRSRFVRDSCRRYILYKRNGITKGGTKPFWATTVRLHSIDASNVKTRMLTGEEEEEGNVVVTERSEGKERE